MHPVPVLHGTEFELEGGEGFAGLFDGGEEELDELFVHVGLVFFEVGGQLVRDGAGVDGRVIDGRKAYGVFGHHRFVSDDLEAVRLASAGAGSPHATGLFTRLELKIGRTLKDKGRVLRLAGIGGLGAEI